MVGNVSPYLHLRFMELIVLRTPGKTHFFP